MSIQDKVVVITGGGTGIGLATALIFNRTGANVIIGGRRTTALAEVAKQAHGKNAIRFHELDVADRSSVEKFFAWVKTQAGEVDILINAAGVNIKDRSLSAMSPQQWDDVMKINATGPYNCIYQVIDSMRKRKSGLILNISSVAGKRAIALGGVAYSASKFAMTAMGTCISNEVNQDGVRVTNVYPGEVNTPILDNRPTPVSDDHRKSILQPDDIARVLLSLAEMPPHVHVPEIVIKPTHQGWY